MSKNVRSIIIRDSKFELYLTDLPLYKGAERWSSNKKEAYCFDDKDQAEEAVDALIAKKTDVAYVSIMTPDKPMKGTHKRNVRVEVYYHPENSALFYWRSMTFLQALSQAFANARKCGHEAVEKITIVSQG